MSERTSPEQFTMAEMVERLLNAIVAIEVSGEWVHAVTRCDDGRYNRHPLADFELSEEADAAAAELALQHDVPVVRQVRGSQSIDDVMSSVEV